MGVGTLAVLTLALASSSWQPAAGGGQPPTQQPSPDAAQVKLGEERMDPGKDKASAIAAAKAHLVKSLKVELEKVELESATAATWPDASLGCPEKDRMYAQVVTDGYKVRLKVDGRSHEVHVAGSRVVSCPGPPSK